jgi:hypothetical protein
VADEGGNSEKDEGCCDYYTVGIVAVVVAVVASAVAGNLA